MNNFTFSFQDLGLTVGGAFVLWLLSKARTGTFFLALHLARWQITRQLRKIKRARVDVFAIQREIIKESTLFACFVLSFLLAVGFYLSASSDKSLAVKLAIMITLMVPTLLLEAWWLFHQDYVSTLLKYAAKVGPGFRRAIRKYPQGRRRTSDRQARREKSASRKPTYVRVVSRS
ncbi:hypothetical protein IAE33_001652 [Pseudomonas sp. S60]|uniref:hypothetical protein n=1 Tax=Pseudomonas sp. S60 TaxID=211124 RepID=UPI001911A3EA|nr:hypothetical protein [Pseudomonas sp. S60]MBK5009792.1 hypothetical protein [Pseudomonas sp. S60]